MPGSMPTSFAPLHAFLTRSFLPLRHQNMPGPVFCGSSGHLTSLPFSSGRTDACPSSTRASKRQRRTRCSWSVFTPFASFRNVFDTFFQSMSFTSKKWPHFSSSASRANSTSAT